MSKHSPCINVCRMDAASGLCLGCARTREEIAMWRDAPAAILEQVWAELPRRRARLGIELRRLAWSPAEIMDFVCDTIRPEKGTWVMGCYGAVAEFCVGADEVVRCDRDAAQVAAETQRGAIRLRVDEGVCVLALTIADASAKRELIVMAVPRGSQQGRCPDTLVALGSDREAVRPAFRQDMLFDLGIGIGRSSFCVRTADRSLAEDLGRQAGRKWPESLPVLGSRILELSPHRVVCGPFGRIEVFTPIPPPGGRSPDGPHTHLLPAHLAAGRETPPGLQIPEAFAVGAVFYPATGPSESCT